MNKVLTVTFVDGSFKVIKNVLEYICGIDYFCVVTGEKTPEKEAESQCFNRDFISDIKRKYPDGESKSVLLKKRVTG